MCTVYKLHDSPRWRLPGIQGLRTISAAEWASVRLLRTGQADYCAITAGSILDGGYAQRGTTMRRRILIVSPDVAGVSAALKVLIAAGYEADGAGTFEDATRLLATQPPDLLITDERLGPYNGLHLIIRGHAADPHMNAIVTTPIKIG